MQRSAGLLDSRKRGTPNSKDSRLRRHGAQLRSCAPIPLLLSPFFASFGKTPLPLGHSMATPSSGPQPPGGIDKRSLSMALRIRRAAGHTSPPPPRDTRGPCPSNRRFSFRPPRGSSNTRTPPAVRSPCGPTPAPPRPGRRRPLGTVPCRNGAYGPSTCPDTA